ncbi:MAG: prolyl-tRNA synthetase associated domain-containing protein [Patescibacteria group bacterium]|jgi:Ala-tRNA(Pro) deacylase
MSNIYTILSELNIKFLEHKHPALFTCADAEQYYGKIPGGKSKNLFLRNRKGNQHYLVVVETNKMLDLKRLTQALGETPLSFASPQRLLKYLGLTPGSVSPFGLINDVNKEVIVVIDNDLWHHEHVNFHPNVNTATLELDREDFKKFLQWSGQKVMTVDLNDYHIM